MEIVDRFQIGDLFIERRKPAFLKYKSFKLNNPEVHIDPNCGFTIWTHAPNIAQLTNGQLLFGCDAEKKFMFLGVAWDNEKPDLTHAFDLVRHSEEAMHFPDDFFTQAEVNLTPVPCDPEIFNLRNYIRCCASCAELSPDVTVVMSTNNLGGLFIGIIMKNTK